MEIFENIFTSMIHASTPLLLAAMGEVVSQRSGVINIGIEGMMLFGALFGLLGSYYTSGLPILAPWILPILAPWIGILTAGLSGLITAAIFSYFAIRLRGDQIVIGTAITLLALGFTEVVYRRLWGGIDKQLGIHDFKVIEIPLLDNIPIIGEILFSHNIVVFLAFLLVPCVYFFLYHTQYGLKVRACGEHPKAISTVGYNVLKIRTICMLFAGTMAGIGGAYLTLADVPYFSPGMTFGRGFVALAIVIFGKWHPIKAFAAALLFGLGYAMDAQFQALGLGIQYQWFKMLPFVLCLTVLAGFVGRAEAPLALGRPYDPSE